MIRIKEEFERNLNEDIIDKIMEQNGFESLISDDKYILNFSKIEPELDNSEIRISVYIDDAEDENKYSLSVSTPNIDDYAYLSDYMSDKDELEAWFKEDYEVVLSQIQDLYDT